MKYCAFSTKHAIICTDYCWIWVQFGAVQASGRQNTSTWRVPEGDQGGDQAGGVSPPNTRKSKKDPFRDQESVGVRPPHGSPNGWVVPTPGWDIPMRVGRETSENSKKSTQWGRNRCTVSLLWRSLCRSKNYQKLLKLLFYGTFMYNNITNFIYSHNSNSKISNLLVGE